MYDFKIIQCRMFYMFKSLRRGFAFASAFAPSKVNILHCEWWMLKWHSWNSLAHRTLQRKANG